MAELTLEERVKEAIDSIRPSLQLDGGDIQFLGIENNKAKVRLLGACHGCPHSAMTLHYGVERHLKSKVPEIEGIIAS